MKYNMAISLSNHEDRIKKLEDKKLEWVLILNNIDNSINTNVGAIVPLEHNLSMFDIVMFEFVTYNPSQATFCQAIAYGKELYNRSNTNYLYNLTPVWNQYGLFVDIFPYSEGMSFKIANASNYYKYIRVIRGLKLYYNFSYNIYRLANSISFHFFKCLINSFKGGVKEIWQLV